MAIDNPFNHSELEKQTHISCSSHLRAEGWLQHCWAQLSFKCLLVWGPRLKKQLFSWQTAKIQSKRLGDARARKSRGIWSFCVHVICQIDVKLAKASHMPTPQSLLEEVHSAYREREHCKVTWKGACVGVITLIPSLPHGNSIPLTSEGLSALRCSSSQMRLEGKFSGASEKEKEMCSWRNFVPLEHVKLSPGAQRDVRYQPLAGLSVPLTALGRCY